MELERGKENNQNKVFNIENTHVHVQYKEPENSRALLCFLAQQDHPHILLPVPSAAVKIT